MAKLPDLFGRGVLASRPAAGIAGRHYHSTDSTPPTTFRDNGSSWDAEATAGAATVTTTRGDLIVRGASADTRLAVGAANRLLRSDGTDPSWGQVVEADLNLTDVATANVGITKHGFVPKAPNDATKYLDGTGAFSVPAGGGGGGGTPALFAGAKAYSNATQAITTGADRAITFNTEDWDTDAYHDNAVNPSRFTIPTGKGGKYSLVGHLYGLSGSNHDVRFKVNGTALYSDVLYTAATGGAITLSAVLDLVAGDYVELVVFPGANVTTGHATVREAMNDLSLHLIGGAAAVVVFAGAKAYMAGTQAVASGGDRAITFDTEDWDTDGYHDTVTNNSRFTIPAGKGGKYLVEAHIWHPAAFSSDVQFRINGTTLLVAHRFAGSAGEGFTATWVGNLGAGDYIEVIINPDAGTPNIGHATLRNVQNEMSLTLIGGAPYSLGELAYVEGVGSGGLIAITATTEATANAVVSAGAVTYAGTPVLIEFGAPYLRSRASNVLFLILFDGSTPLGQLGIVGGGAMSDCYHPGAVMRRRLTPSAGAHTYNVKAYISGGATGEVGCDTGGTGAALPAYIRITAA